MSEEKISDEKMSQETTQTSKLDQAKDLLVQGKRFMALEDFQSATDCLEESCRLFDAHYGVGKRECADAYLEYGLALVALANLENILLKDSGKDDEEEDDDSEPMEEDQNEVDSAQIDEEPKETVLVDGQEDFPEIKGEEVVISSNGEQSTSISADNVVSEPSAHFSNGATDTSSLDVNPSTSQQDPQPSTSGQQDQDNLDEENEEASTIEIAWEVLCLAKRVFMTDESLEARIKLAETLQKLGEISIEWDNNDNAVSILQECLKIRTAILPQDDRLIASTYYHLGLAHSFKNETQDANDSLQNAINVIEKRIASQSQMLDIAKANEDTIAIAVYEKEINELKELLPEMIMRIDDSKDEGGIDALKRTREEMVEEDESVKKVCSDNSKPVDDITHLVKRRAP